MIRLLVSIFCALAFAACGSRAERWELPLDASGPVVAGNELLFLQRTTGLLIALEPGKPTRSFATGSDPRDLAVIGGDALVLGPDALDRFVLPGGDRTSIALPGNWDRIALAPNQQHALLFSDPDRIDPASPVRDLNEIGVVDLAAGSATAVRLQTESLAPRQVVFAPDGTLAAVLFDAAIVLLDPRAPEHTIQIPLRLPGGAVLHPREALFDQAGSRLFVRAEGSNEVLAVELLRSETTFDVALNFLGLAGAGGLEDILVPAGAADEVVALWHGVAALLDGSGDVSRTQVVSTPAAADTIGQLEDGVLLFYSSPSHAAGSANLAAWDPAAGLSDYDQLSGPIAVPTQIADGTALFAQSTGDGGALTVVTVERQATRLKIRQHPWAVTGRPVATAASADGAFYASVTITRKGSGAVASDDLQTGSIVRVDGGADSVILDDPAQVLGLAGDWLFALRSDDLGDVTFVPRAALTRSKAIRYQGFLATGLLGPEED